MSEEAVKKRMKDLTSGVANLAMNDDLEKTETERIDLFHDFVKKLVDESKDEVGFYLYMKPKFIVLCLYFF